MRESRAQARIKYSLRRKLIKTGDMRLGFYTSRGRKFPNGNFRTSVFCEVKTHLVGKTSVFRQIKQKPLRFLGRVNGACGRTRTGDLRITNALLISGLRAALRAVGLRNARLRTSVPTEPRFDLYIYEKQKSLRNFGRTLELAAGLEPATCALRMRCSTN